MRKLLLALLLLPGVCFGQESITRVPKGTLPLGTTTIGRLTQYTNQILFGYGALITNTVAVANPVPSFPMQLYNGARIYGLTVLNTDTDPTKTSAALGFNGTVGTPTGTKFEVHDLTVTGATYAVHMYASNNFGSDWYNCRLFANYIPIVCGSGTNKFWNCIFASDGPSEYSGAANGAYQSYGFACDGFHGPDTSSTNWLFDCIIRSKNSMGTNGSLLAATIGLEVEFQANCVLNGCIIDVADKTGQLYQTTAINFIEDNERAELNGCTIYWGGGTNGSDVVATTLGSGATNNVLVLNNTFYYPTTNGVCIDNGLCPVYVSGGNWVPANFTHPEKVVWSIPPWGTTAVMTNSYVTNITIDFPSTATATSSDVNSGIPSLKSNDFVTVLTPFAVRTNTAFVYAWMSNATCWISLQNYKGSNIDPPPAIFPVKVEQFK